MRQIHALIATAALLGTLSDARGGDAEPPVRYFESAAVSAAFAHGSPLIEQSGYKVHASRRDKPGEVEVHLLDTDIIHVLEGEATFVTGGSMHSGRTIAPNELRGGSIAGGTTRHLVPGDVIIVPRGTPHWFQSVRGPFLYYTVKVSS